MASAPFKSIQVSLECIVLGFDNTELNILLRKEDSKNGKGKHSLFTGTIKESDHLDKSVKRTLSDVPEIKPDYTVPLSYYAATDRYPKNRIIGLSLLVCTHYAEIGSNDASGARWFPVSALPGMAFDHKEIVKNALNSLREKSLTSGILFQLLPVKFTLSQLQLLYESVWNKSLDKRNFRKKLLMMNIVKPLNQYEKSVAHKAAQLYSLHSKGLQEFFAQGGIFTF